MCSLPPHSARLCLPNGMSPTRLKTRGLSPPGPGIKLPSSGGLETGQRLTMALNEDLRTVADGAGGEGQSGKGSQFARPATWRPGFPRPLCLSLCLTHRAWSWALAGGSKGGIACASIKHGFPVKI